MLSDGCQQRMYRIEMSIEEGRVNRRFVGTNLTTENDREDDQLTEEEAQLLTVYGTEVRQNDDGKTLAKGLFTGRLPVDVGGAGNVHHYASNMGTLSVYLERFRGSDDLAAQVDEISQAVDELIELARKWVKQECEDAEIARNMDRYLTDAGRRDIRNLSLFIWGVQLTVENQADENILSNATSRIMQYALERDYIYFEDIPSLIRLSREEDEQAILATCRRLLARYLQTNEARIMQAFPAMANPQAFEQSLKKSFSDDDLDALFASVIRIRLFGNERLTVRFKLPRRPLWTNGTWVDETRVEWTAKLSPRKKAERSVLPTQCYAVWCEPDVDFQQAHIGQVLLDDAELAEYVLWSAGLSESESKEWETFLATITPDDDVAARLEGFEFFTPANMSQTASTNLMDTPRRLFAPDDQTKTD